MVKHSAGTSLILVLGLIFPAIVLGQTVGRVAVTDGVAIEYEIVSEGASTLVRHFVTLEAPAEFNRMLEDVLRQNRMQARDRYDGPIIDMHLHAFDEVWAERQICFPSPCKGAATLATSGDELKPMTLAAMERNNIVMGVISGSRDVVLSWTEGEDEKFYAGLSLFSPTDVPMEELRRLYQSGRVRVLGEIATQYSNIAIDDASLDPLFAMAHELDIPVHVHVLGLGGSPDFPSHLGNPLRLVPVLRKYPGLRVYLESPIGDQ